MSTKEGGAIVERKLLEQSQQYKAKHKKKRRFKKIFNILACVVVFCVTYALILPAITMEKKSYCGYEEHTHGDKCYSKALICAMQEGENAEGHSHGDGCYSEEKTLVCQSAESAGHTHSDACKTTERTLACGTEESEEHVHNDACYQVSEKIVCGVEESSGHTHGEACYENKKVVICTLPEASAEGGHKHKDSCYEKKLTCEKEEHEHKLICHSDKNADVETSSDWEATLPKELTGVWADDVLAIADSQLGYEESSKNYDVTEDGKTLGYTRYGDWYGDSYGHWCAMYVSFCLHYANVDTDMIPLDANCQHWIDTLSKEEYNLYHEAGTYEPVPGDLIFFNWDSDPKSEHIGLVVEYTPATEDEPAEVRTIEGNASDVVKYKTYKADDSRIMGYGELPENPELEEAMEKQTLEASIYTDETFETEAKEDKTVITVNGYFPEGIEAKAYPVELEEETIEGRRVLLAYDITLFDKDGNVYDTEELEIPMTVTIEPAEWSIEDEEVDSEDCEVYYVPEEGEPESMETSTEEDVVSFQTDHFSTYALTVGGNLSTVYLNGASGNDSRAGTSSGTAVKTLDKALSLVKNDGTIYITGTVTVNDAKELDIEKGQNVTIKRYSSFTGALITVANGGSLKLGNIRIHGGTSGPSTGSIETTITYATIDTRTYAKAPLIIVNSGGSLEITEGAFLEYNSNQPDSVSTKNHVGQGGAVYCQGNLTMTGGTIQYCEALSGGGIYIQSANTNRIQFDFSGGVIKYNYAREIKGTSNSARKNPYHSNAGGGVFVGDYVTMNMSGGEVSYNQSAREGGGISLGWLDRNNGSAIENFITTFNMTGGLITQNTATSTGGGLNITAGREAYIYAGEFTYNKANGREFQPKDDYDNMWEVYSGGGIYVDAEQYDSRGNYAGKPGYALIHRVLITQNKSGAYGGGIATCKTSQGTVNASIDLDGTLIYNNTASTSSSNEMYLNSEGDVSLVGSKMLGGAAYSWTSSGTYYDNALTDTSAEVVAGKPLATVEIKNNTAGESGGGIGCNGHIEIGGKPNKISLSITKVWDDDGTVEHPDYITVELWKDNALYDVVKLEKKVDAEGKESWPIYFVDGLPAGKYTIKEIAVPGYEPTITQNGNSFIITNKKPVTSISVEKKWAGETPDDISIKVQLLADGVAYGAPVDLPTNNSWFYKWENLPKLGENGKEIIYTVSEIPVPGYTSSVAKTEYTVESGNTYKWVPVTDGIKSGKTYMFVSNNGALSRNGTSLKWTDVSSILASGKEADSTNLWTYTNSKLKNGSYYLSMGYDYEYSNYGYNYYYFYKLDSSGININFSDGKISANYYSNTRYLISDLTRTDTKSSNAIKFTVYERVQGKAEPITNPHFVITNTKNPDSITVNFAKYAKGGDGPTLLAGADLALYKLDSSGSTIPGTTVAGTLVGEWTSKDVTDATKGIHTVDLYSGTYYLVETKTPDGHAGLKGPIIFNVDAENGTVEIVDYPGYEELEGIADATDFRIYNEILYELPETGGIGTNVFTIGGAIIMLGSLFAGYMMKRRREGEA